MPAQEPISPGQIKPESSREPQTSSRLQQTNVNLQAPPKSEERYSLIKYVDGKLVLKGGSKEDRIAARQWISMFLNGAVVREV